MRRKKNYGPVDTVFCANGAGPNYPGCWGLEVDLATELQDSWVRCACELAEPAVSKRTIDVDELRVVPRIECFQTQFQTAPALCIERETLEQ